jgi:superfamily II RNA helicase
MSDKHQKALKRKKKLKKRAQKAASSSQQELFYDGKKFLSERYFPVMHAIERWICTVDKAIDLRGEPELTDGTVGRIYANLIKEFRDLGFAPIPEDPLREFSWREDFVPTHHCLENLMKILK